MGGCTEAAANAHPDDADCGDDDDEDDDDDDDASDANENGDRHVIAQGGDASQGIQLAAYRLRPPMYPTPPHGDRSHIYSLHMHALSMGSGDCPSVHLAIGYTASLPSPSWCYSPVPTRFFISISLLLPRFF